jgi:prepilin-type N-terminal cleavage/methylation domain-containing protein
VLRRRAGFTLIELIVVVAIAAIAVSGWWYLYHRVEKLSDWASRQDTWNEQVYDWIRLSSFQQGNADDGGDPDGQKPPPPPDDL